MRRSPASTAAEGNLSKRRILRLVGLALLVLYVATLVAAAWPRLLQPVPGTVSVPQLAALELLHRITVYPGQEVFTGERRPREVATAWCVQITGHKPSSWTTLYDDTMECREARRPYFKDPWTTFVRKRLARAFRHIEHPDAHRNLNQYPLNYLFGIAEYFCRRGDGFRALTIRTFRRSLNLDTGAQERSQRDEGTFRCASGEWVVR